MTLLPGLVTTSHGRDNRNRVGVLRPRSWGSRQSVPFVIFPHMCKGPGPARSQGCLHWLFLPTSGHGRLATAQVQPHASTHLHGCGRWQWWKQPGPAVGLLLPVSPGGVGSSAPAVRLLLQKTCLDPPPLADSAISRWGAGAPPKHSLLSPNLVVFAWQPWDQ